MLWINFTHKEHIYQPLQTNNKQFEIVLTFSTGYNGIFNVTDKNNKFNFAKSVTNKDGFLQITLSPGAYEKDSLKDEIRRIIIDEGHFTETDYPITTQPNFSTLGSIIEISRRDPLISYLPHCNKRNLLGFNASTISEEYNVSHNTVNKLSFDNIFLEADFAHGKIFKGRRPGTIHNFTMDADPGYIFIEEFRGGVQW